MKRVLMIASLILLAGCTDEEGAKRALSAQGFHDIAMTGYRAWLCDSKDDTYSTGFEATGPAGTRVTGAVCSGWLKGHTIRFD